MTELILSVDSWTTGKKLLADGRELTPESKTDWPKKIFSCTAFYLPVQQFAKIELDAPYVYDIFTACISNGHSSILVGGV